MFNIPFNNQPISTGAGSSTYTVTSGKYARLTFTCKASAWLVLTANSALNPQPSNCAETETITGSVWLKAGDAITVSLSNPSGSVVGAAGVNNIQASCTATILLNSTAFASATATVANFWQGTGTTISRDGSSSVQFMYEEYNVIS